MHFRFCGERTSLNTLWSGHHEYSLLESKILLFQPPHLSLMRVLTLLCAQYQTLLIYFVTLPKLYFLLSFCCLLGPSYFSSTALASHFCRLHYTLVALWQAVYFASASSIASATSQHCQTHCHHRVHPTAQSFCFGDEIFMDTIACGRHGCHPWVMGNKTPWSSLAINCRFK